MTGLEKFTIMAYDGRTAGRAVADIITETSLEIIFNDRRVVTLACTGNHGEELAVGYLKSEGLIGTRDDIDRSEVCPGACSVRIYSAKASSVELLYGQAGLTIASSGARGTSRGRVLQPFPGDNRPLVPAGKAIALVDDLLRSARLHEATHGTHCSALAGVEGIVVSREDIGRHNTLDMLGGYILLHRIDCTEKIVLTTGRISTEMVTKVWNMGVPVIISHSAPTTKACRLAVEAGMTLIGYVRGGTMNVYAGEGRVVA
jgi:FdhD protein